MKRKYVWGAVLAVLILAAAVLFQGGGHAPAGQPPLEKVTAANVSDVRDAFNAARGETRVLLLLSPT